MRMKRFLGILLTVLLCLTGCSSPAEPADTPPAEGPAAAEPVVAETEQPEASDYADIKAPFENFCEGAEVRVKKRDTHFEVYVTCNDLSADAQPDDWEEICAAAIAAATESKAIATDAYGVKMLSFQIEDGTETILGSGTNTGLTYDIFSVSTVQEKNDPTITLAEYNKIVVGMTYSQCVEIIGGDGVLQSEIGTAGTSVGVIRNYTWQGTQDYASASISFDNYVVYSKVQFGLE